MLFRSSAASPPQTATPVPLPPGVPASYEPDDEPGDVPPEALVPREAEVTGTTFARFPSAGTAIVVTYARGEDPFAREQGLLVWRRFPRSPHWRATFGFLDPARKEVLGIRVEIGDATGDGLPDALAFETVGGTGVCGSWRLVQIAEGTAVPAYPLMTCDASMEISADPVGLVLTEAVFKQGDPHCCPSRFRTTQLEWNGEIFEEMSRETHPANP